MDAAMCITRVFFLLYACACVRLCVCMPSDWFLVSSACFPMYSLYMCACFSNMGRFISLYPRQIDMVRWRTGLQARV